VLGSTVFLISDLGVPGGFLRAAARPGSSWISRGVYILSIFIIIGLVNIFLRIWPLHILEEAMEVRFMLEGAGFALSFLTMVYTGLLLGAVKPIPFWNNAMVPLLFLASAVSTGLMALMLVISLSPLASNILHQTQMQTLVRADALTLIFESVIVLFYLYGCSSAPASRPSVSMLTTGALAPLFWSGFVAAGLVLPLVLELAQSYTYRGADAAVAAGLAMAVSIPGLAGGLFLRYLIVAGGMKVPLGVTGVLVKVSGKARF
jgi:formate-dependent nitrite reductase membrane component NrfD